MGEESGSEEDINLRPVLPTFKSKEDDLSQHNESEIDSDFNKQFRDDNSIIPLKIGVNKPIQSQTRRDLATGDSSEDVETDDETSLGSDGDLYQQQSENAGDLDTDLHGPKGGPPTRIPLHNASHIELSPAGSTAQLHKSPSSSSTIALSVLDQDRLRKRTWGLPGVSFIPSLSNVLHRNHHPNDGDDSLGKIRRGNQKDIELGEMNKLSDLGELDLGTFSGNVEEYTDYDYMRPEESTKPKMGITGSIMKLWEEFPHEAERPRRELEQDQSKFVNTLEVMDNPKKLRNEVVRGRQRTKRHTSGQIWHDLARSASRERSRTSSRSRSHAVQGKNSAIQLVKSIGSSVRSADTDLANEIPLPAKDNTDDVPRLPSFHFIDPTTEHKFSRQRAKSAHMARITVHISDVLTRQKFLLMLCKAFMLFGAPNHRLEEYMTLTANVLEIEASFLYFPGIMLASFGDPVMRTTDMKLIRVGQGLDLGKLDEAHEIYDLVVHDRLGVDEACERLDNLLTRKPLFSTLLLILFYGINSAFIIIWFGGSWADMGPSAAMGMVVGFLQLVVAPRNTMYSSVFEVGSCILVSFLGRALGSIRLPGHTEELFCYPAITLSGLSMILPGYIILSGALEIQARSIVSGTVRMFYAIIYSLFMGFGMTLGSGIYGWIDGAATMRSSCTSNLPVLMNLLFIPMFAITMGLACQASLKQVPIMVLIACAGYTVDYFSALHLPMTQFNAAMGAFTIGIMSNLYSKFGRRYRYLRAVAYCETAFTSMLVGIFCLVPGGIAGRNVLASGLGLLDDNNKSSIEDLVSTSTLTFGIMMIEVAIGITVGLFLAALVVYPFGKKRTGLFSL